MQIEGTAAIVTGGASGLGNATARAIQIRESDTIREEALLELFRSVIARNRAGGWRRLRP